MLLHDEQQHMYTTHQLSRHYHHPLVSEVVNLVIVYPLNSDDIGLQGAVCMILVRQRIGRLTAYAELYPTVAMIVIKTCSFTVKGPGFKDTPKTLTRGTIRAQSLPIGKDNSCATIY